MAESARDLKVCVIGHARPDGDCVGSQIGAVAMLKAFGIQSFSVNADIVPSELEYLEDASSISIVEPEALDDAVLFYVDCADEGRVGPKTSIALEERRRLANIDHHITNTNFADTNIVDSDASATCEILAGIAVDLKLAGICLCGPGVLYGHSNGYGPIWIAATSSRVFELCSELTRMGASPQRAAESLYENVTLARLKLLERFLSSLEYACEGNVCIGSLLQKDFIDTGTSYQDTEGFVDYARSVSESIAGREKEHYQGKPSSEAERHSRGPDRRAVWRRRACLRRRHEQPA